MDKGGFDRTSVQSWIALFNFAFMHAPIGIALVDTDGHLLRANQAFSNLIGYPLTQLEGMHFKDFTHPEDIALDLRLFNEVLAAQRDGYKVEKRYIRSDGSTVYVVIHVAAMRDDKGEVVRFISQIEDITGAKTAERELRERAAMLSLAMDAINGGFWHLDVKSDIFETSDKLAELINGPGAERLNLQAYLSKINPHDLSAADLTHLLSGRVEHAVTEYRLNTNNGERWMRCERRLLRDGDGAPLKIVGVALDFTPERTRLADLELRSRTDVLSGLLNRHGLEIGYRELNCDEGYSVLAIDLDGFKAVNDRLGHAMGDAVLVQTAKRLSSTVDACDLVARMGGDEFAVVHGGSRVDGLRLANSILEAMRLPIVIDQVVTGVGISVGCVWTREKREITLLLARADDLLYEVKSEGKNGMRSYSVD
ncbi:diguanylate cyclase [Brucella sp. NBRC 12950]|uniref:diguanylate cyclase n=1 Tax=Brucella sp. NBRC 12950 TaxID=2994518 RepID=UPI00249FF186|nr:diguanylate cyclase [Brucella sp. NBRC 12950]GLU29294.1 hypothetical protein Brsp01_45270 [Brucella sp. NBRC 12950]